MLFSEGFFANAQMMTSVGSLNGCSTIEPYSIRSEDTVSFIS
jgi:hypothetical protein